MLHLAALAALYAATPIAVGGDGIRRVHNASDRQRVSASLESARRQHMQRQVRELERIQREMAGEGPAQLEDAKPLPTDPQALQQRARELAQRMQAKEQEQRAQELARLLKIPPEEALRRVRASPRQALPPPQASVQALLEHAQARQKAEQQRLADAKQGLQAKAEQRAVAPQGQKTKKAGEGAHDGKGGINARSGNRGASENSGDGGIGVSRASSQRGAPGKGGGGGAGSAGPGSGQSGDIGRLEGGRGGGVLDVRAYGELVASAALDPSTLHLQQGRRIGPGGPFSNRVLIDRWMLVGPFDGQGPAALEDPQTPELAVDLDAVYQGKGERLLQWQPITVPPYPVVPNPRHANAVYYAYTELHSDKDQTVRLEVGADDDSKLWLNDELVWRSDPRQDKPWYRQPFHELTERIAQHNLVEGRVRVRLRAGRNVLLFKLYNGIDLTFFSVVLVP